MRQGRAVSAVTGHVIPVEDFLMAVEGNDSLLLPAASIDFILSHRRMPPLCQDLGVLTREDT